MNKNMRTIYRSILTVMAVIIGILYFAGQISDPAAIVVGLFAGAFLITSVTSFCPTYLPCKLNTSKQTS